MNFVKSLSVLLALSLAATAAAQEGTPVFVQPPQTQTPQPPAQPTVPVLSPVQALPTPAAVLASAAPAPAPDGVTLWGGLASELLVLPLLNLNLSVPVAQGPGYSVSARVGLETFFGASAVEADVLLGRPGGQGVYGGPGAAYIFGQDLKGWRAGVNVGYRDTFGQSRVGYYAEAKLNYLSVLTTGSCGYGDPAYAPSDTCTSDFSIASPGLRFGLTYRF
jgi:hypothetical protein